MPSAGAWLAAFANEVITAHDAHAPIAYPEIRYVTSRMRKQAREAGDASAIILWAGESYPVARERRAGELVAELAREAEQAAAALSARLARRVTEDTSLRTV